MTRSLLSRLRNKLGRDLKRTLARIRIAARTKHVSGLRKITLGDSEVVLVCMLKDAEYYLDQLLSHHRSLGVKHFVFIDNGSTDKTTQILADAADVSVFSNTLPVREFECRLRSQISRRFVKGGWFLFVDSDELIAFGRGEQRNITEFTSYCNAHGYNAAVAQCLDLFSTQTLGTTAQWTYARCVSEFVEYTLSNITLYDYHDSHAVELAWFLRNNTVSNDEIKLMFGGIRNEVFGEQCCLTTHRLVRNERQIELYSHAHCSGNVRCADFAFLIKHYKFAGDFLQREQAQVQDLSWDHGENFKRVSTIQGTTEFVISSKQQQTLVDIEALISDGFLACSARYLQKFPYHSQSSNEEQKPISAAQPIADRGPV